MGEVPDHWLTSLEKIQYNAPKCIGMISLKGEMWMILERVLYNELSKIVICMIVL
jgi:hypothetical protein